MGLFIVVCDDNREFTGQLRNRILDYCARTDCSCECETCCSSEELLGMDLSSAQVLFLDIDMPGEDGLETARQLRTVYPDLIIVFVTAWIQYAPYGYQVNAFRYLLKPRLDKEFPDCMDAIMEKVASSSVSVVLLGKNGYYRIPVSHILYFEGGSGRKVLTHKVGTRDCIDECIGTLSEFEENVIPKGFLRIQKSYLVNMRYIAHISNYEVILTNGEHLKASRSNFNRIKSDYALWRVNNL